MGVLLIRVDGALPALQAYLAARGREALDPGEAEIVAQLLERCVRTGGALVTFALHVAGRPSAQ